MAASGGYPSGADAGRGAPPDALQAELLRLRAENQAAAKENSRMRAAAADKQFEVQQLDKQIRKLERRIEALEDAGRKKSAVAKGFFKPMPADYKCPPVEQKPPEKPQEPQASPWEKAKAEGTGVIIDGDTGREVKPDEYWPEDEEEKEKNILLRPGGYSPEAELMQEMQFPVEVNPDFDTARYAALLGNQKREEAEEMIKNEGGPTLEQMQRTPLEVLRKYPRLDPNYIDPMHDGCSLLQWACTMGFDEVAMKLIERRADVNHRTNSGVSCLQGACAQNWACCAHHLLEHRASPNETVDPDNGRTLLMWASRVEYCDADGNGALNPFVALLLSHRVDLEAVDRRGQTALLHASTEGSEPAVEALLAARADSEAKDSEGNTALQIALKYYHGKISSMLLAHRKATRSVSAEAASSFSAANAGVGANAQTRPVQVPKDASAAEGSASEQ